MSELPSSSSSSCSSRKRKRDQFKYNIFLSFHGGDTRKGFTGHLYNALKQQGIKAFRDDRNLERGEYFAPELLRAIGESWGSIIVLSERYASSKWCLKELVQIMKQEERGHRVYPNFYHVPPSDFRHQINSVKEAFDKHEQRYNKKMKEEWRAALTKVTGINGWFLQDQYESEVIDNIVRDVSQKIYVDNLDEQEVKKMKSTFRTIQAWLVDAENKQYMKEGEAVKVWLDKLKHFAYDMDDVLDEWNTGLLKSKIEKAQGQTPTTSSSSPSEVRNIPLKIKELKDRYQAIVKEKDLLKIVIKKDDFSSAHGQNNSYTEQRKTASLIDESVVYGRDHDRDAVIHLLLSNDNSEGGSGNGVPLIAIVGMGGIGKTTLAQLAYNNDKVKKHFDRSIWVCVSDPFDDVRIAKAILEALKGEPSKFNELEGLLQEIRQNIEGKKFLLVLDDVWTPEERKWEQLKLSLCVGSQEQESRILVTTRNENVARILGCPRLFLLGVLSEKNSWSLFRKIAFSGRSDEDRKDLESIGREFAKKCAGLSLAIKTLASLLRCKKTKVQWQGILASDLWKLEEEVFKNLYAPLLLSYYDLPMSLKQCFCYCAIFPKDHWIEKHELIMFWMAQGFLGQTHERNDLEIVGEECFNNLAIRGFFQQFENETDGSIIRCKIHDIVHDFAQYLTKTECFTAESDGIEMFKRVESPCENVRHLTFINPPNNLVPIILDPLEKLRSFLFLSGTYDYEPTLYSSLSKLRMLSFMHTSWVVGQSKSSNILKEIGKLIHLRYLGIEGNPLDELPEVLCDLCNLQILNVRGCPHLQKLPQGMGKLINLRHLRNAGADKIAFMPEGMQRLTCLRTLECFVVVRKSETICGLADLGKLIHLRGHLEIRGLGNVGEASEAREAQLSTKAELRSLTLAFDGGCGKERQRRIDDEAAVLQALHPPQHLQILHIRSSDGTVFPFSNWMSSLTLLKSVKLDLCENWESLPSLGKLQSLESLSIASMGRVKKVGEEFLGVETSSSSSSSVNHNDNIAFPNLKTLKFADMSDWEEWEYDEKVLRSRGGGSSSNIPIIIMPKLQCLSIQHCPRLKTLPRHLLQSKALQELVITFNTFLYRQFNKETGKDRHSISHIPFVEITRARSMC